MAEPKPSDQYDAGEAPPSWEAILAGAEALMDMIRERVEWEAQNEYMRVFHPLIDWPEPVDAAGHVTVSSAGVGLGGEERGE